MDDVRQGSKERVVRAFVAAEKAADDAGAFRSAAPEFVENRKRCRRRWERRQIRRFAHAGRARQHVRVTLRKEDDVSLAEGEWRLTDDLSPARSPRDDVIF